jgi:hypothetical protein
MITKEDIDAIRKIEDTYGLPLFRMALTLLVDVGVRHFNDAGTVADDIEQIIAQREADKNNGKIPIMTLEFQCEIVRCAAELAGFSIWTLFKYIKKYVVIGGI